MASCTSHRYPTYLLSRPPGQILRAVQKERTQLGTKLWNRQRKHSSLVVYSRERDFQEKASDAADGFKRKSLEFASSFSEIAADALVAAKQKLVAFGEENDLNGKAQKAFRAANEKYVEIGDNIKRSGARIAEEYELSAKARQAASAVTEKVQDIDQRFGIKQKVGEISQDFRINLPRYRRQLRAFLNTPIGQLFTFVFFAWFLLSGWLFRILFWSAWILPLAPLLLQGLVKQATIQGTCPACGQAYVGAKSTVIVCRRCRGVVWQPGQTGGQSFNKNDPTIIDIDAE